MAGIRVLGINGSARKYGNSFKMLWIALKAAEDEGAETEIIHLYDYKLILCMACYSDNLYECYYPKRCPLGLEDQYHEIAEKILSSHAVIFSTPVYWFMASAAVKTLVERMTGMENMLYHIGKSLLDGKVAGIIAVGEETGATMALSWLMLTLNMMGFHIPAWATVYYHGKGDAMDNEQAVLDAYNLGRNVARLAKILAGKVDGEPWYSLDYRSRARQLAEEAKKTAMNNREAARRDRPWL
ncbi:flavodoxin family protein [Hyperthermus butylicus]|uniref:Multimeric flavodoxin, WrbA n=1 Tax=Hyperthermus butylicus (strain DSM 5456 / JCM 9403 / PLM1-5) TaxID=415426 RepID=A2BJV4_HYPBU|nr:flavodoxin family protein [Hyperthermus butylicus]ABM80265.1 multimeric flavodoxin, WrbA [Hyperthermus butylicus DSM 5456]